MTDPLSPVTRPVQLPLPECDAGMVPRVDPMRAVQDLAARVAPVDSTVLVVGESGVGKERLARWIHQASPRRDKPFVAVNCGAFTDSLLETELFGHARGAFTGAVADRAGVFEAAHQGTLLLDEIGDVSPAMQVRLLRVLQERDVRRVGETRSRRIDVRLIAATHRDLRAAVEAGTFRSDLYYRLHVVELRIPPLRDRPGDLETLVRTLLPATAARLGRPVLPLAADALAALRRYAWPGNIRELEHALERACVVATGPTIGLADLPEELAASDRLRAGPSRSLLTESEDATIRAVLARYHGHRGATAAALGMSRSTLLRRIRRGRDRR